VYLTSIFLYHFVGKSDWHASVHIHRVQKTYSYARANKYWTYWSHAGVMGPVSLVTCCQQKGDFSPLLHWLLRERSWVRTRGSISRRAVDRDRSPSSRGQWICSTLLTTVPKVAIRGPREIRMVGVPYADWAWDAYGVLIRFPLQGVHRFESPRLSDMSNRLFVAVST
jgi:hypothetical protein